jgi:A/G-specific adenine glycosylase
MKQALVFVHDRALDHVLEWYRLHSRSLPWRVNSTPYARWVSEIMCQQSQIATVLPYFERWMLWFPNVHVLAKASPNRVQQAWAGLGYYSRARSLHAAAKQIVERGAFPSSVDEWLALPGVGPYTAKALAAVLGQAPVLPVDGNVIRVVSRLCGVADPLNNPQHRLHVEQVVQNLAARVLVGSHGDFAEALMDLGATVCRPKLPQCSSCPLQEHCKAHETNQVAAIPAPKLRRATTEVLGVAHVVVDECGRVAVKPVQASRRLQGQWELPWTMVRKLEDRLPVVHHSITHHKIQMAWKKLGPQSKLLRLLKTKDLQWVHPKKTKVLLTTLSRKILSQALPKSPKPPKR